MSYCHTGETLDVGNYHLYPCFCLYVFFVFCNLKKSGQLLKRLCCHLCDALYRHVALVCVYVCVCVCVCVYVCVCARARTCVRANVISLLPPSHPLHPTPTPFAPISQTTSRRKICFNVVLHIVRRGLFSFSASLQKDKFWSSLHCS